MLLADRAAAALELNCLELQVRLGYYNYPGYHYIFTPLALRSWCLVKHACIHVMMTNKRRITKDALLKELQDMPSQIH